MMAFTAIAGGIVSPVASVVSKMGVNGVVTVSATQKCAKRMEVEDESKKKSHHL